MHLLRFVHFLEHFVAVITVANEAAAVQELGFS